MHVRNIDRIPYIQRWIQTYIVLATTTYHTELKNNVLRLKSRSRQQNPSPSTSKLPKHNGNLLAQLSYTYLQLLYPLLRDRQGPSHEEGQGMSQAAAHVALPRVCVVVTVVCSPAPGQHLQVHVHPLVVDEACVQMRAHVVTCQLRQDSPVVIWSVIPFDYSLFNSRVHLRNLP